MSSPGAGPNEPWAQFSNRSFAETVSVTSKCRLVPGVIAAPGIWHDSASAGTGPQLHSGPSGVTVWIWTGVAAPRMVAASLTRTGPDGAAVPRLITVMRHETAAPATAAPQVLVIRRAGWPGLLTRHALVGAGLVVGEIALAGNGLTLAQLVMLSAGIVGGNRSSCTPIGVEAPGTSTMPAMSQRILPGPSGPQLHGGDGPKVDEVGAPVG